MQRLASPSTRRAIVALRVYASQLEGERVRLDEEFDFYKSALVVQKRNNEKKKPLVRKALQPIFELNDHMNLNMTEIDQIRRKNSELRLRMEEIECDLRVAHECEKVRDDTEYCNVILSDYQQLLNEFVHPPQLPSRYNLETELNWAIINAEHIDLPEEWSDACRRMVYIRRNFNDLPMNQKRETLTLLRDLRGYIMQVIDELKRIEADVDEPIRRSVLTRRCLKQYAALSVTMRKIRFQSSEQE